jgi:hypothetical protein
MGQPNLNEALKRYDTVVFLDAETHSGANHSYAGAERELTGRGRRRRFGDAAAVVQRGSFGVSGACTCFGLACRGFPRKVAIVLLPGCFVDNGEGYGLQRVKK